MSEFADMSGVEVLAELRHRCLFEGLSSEDAQRLLDAEGDRRQDQVEAVEKREAQKELKRALDRHVAHVYGRKS